MFDARGCLVVCRVAGVALDSKWIFFEFEPQCGHRRGSQFCGGGVPDDPRGTPREEEMIAGPLLVVTRIRTAAG